VRHLNLARYAESCVAVRLRFDGDATASDGADEDDEEEDVDDDDDDEDDDPVDDESSDPTSASES